jgi:hypothetical protein
MSMLPRRKLTFSMIRRSKFPGWAVCAAALVSFAAGSLVRTRLIHPVRAASHRVFELMIYHAMPGKGPALESLFRDVSKLQTKHGLDVIGYWVPNDDPAWSDTFIYLVAHPSRDEATKNWRALHADPDFPPYRRSAEPLIQKADDQFKVDEVYMRPTDYSAMQ